MNFVYIIFSKEYTKFLLFTSSQFLSSSLRASAQQIARALSSFSLSAQYILLFLCHTFPEHNHLLLSSK